MIMPRKLIKPREIYVSIPEDLNQRMETILRSDITGRIPYGARSDLITSLLRNYLDLVDTVQGAAT